VPLILLLLYNLLPASPSDEGTSITCSWLEPATLNLGGCEEIKELSMSLLTYEILEILQQAAEWFGFAWAGVVCPGWLCLS